jgi:uncharacterized membrane protein
MCCLYLAVAVSDRNQNTVADSISNHLLAETFGEYGFLFLKFVQILLFEGCNIQIVVGITFDMPDITQV